MKEKGVMTGFIKLIIVCLCSVSFIFSGQDISQFRGPNRNGVFPAKGLLNTWPESGPKLLWVKEDLDRGYASVSVTEKAIYVTGRKNADEFLTVLDLKGKQLWRIRYGHGVKRTYPDTRCTATIEKDLIYVISGAGEVVCIDGNNKRIKWSIPAYEKFKGEFWQWEIAESPLIVENKVIYTPGGNQTAMVALDKLSGETIWQTKSFNEPSAFVSAILINFKGKKIIATVMTETIFGVDPNNGQILWHVKYSDIDPPTFHAWAPKNNCITPLYSDGQLFVTSGYDHVGVMFKLINGGNAIKRMWVNPTLDCHHGQIVKVGNYIYGANWINNSQGNWCCLDWSTGKTMYEKKWQTKGSISAADGMLYCYEEKRGNLALVEPTPEDFKIVSSFRITQGSGPHWTQPVIHKGVLYIRHGDALMAYDLKEK
jgi:outer membrane protein assembly factor BamB